jgi:hypothetical protein
MSASRKGKSKRNYSEIRLSKEDSLRRSRRKRRREDCYSSNCRGRRSSSRWGDRITARRSRRGSSRGGSNSSNSRKQTEYFDHPT